MSAFTHSLFGRLLRDRARKHGLYDSPAYWDGKVEHYEGLAPSLWPSNAYNARLHARHVALLDRLLPDVTGRRVADVGCGTGRAAIHLASRGARVAGLDFAERPLEAARRAAESAGLAVDVRRWDVLAPPPEDLRGAMDVATTFGCLSVACADRAAFDRALGHVASLVRPGGTVLLLEPAHGSRLLGRILRLRPAAFIDAAAARGLTLLGRGGIAFVPARMALAWRNLPGALVGPAFTAGEALLDASPRMELFADYKWMLFRVPSAGSAAEVPA